MAARRPGGLGRGLDALIPAKKNVEKHETEQTTNNVQNKEKISSPEIKVVEKPVEQTVKVSSIEPNHLQPRKSFNEDSLVELSESIKQYGVIQPLLVSKKEDYYEIIAGERRWRAAKLAGLKEVPVIIKEFAEQQAFEISLIENLQREDLNPVEEALAYKRLIDDFHLKQDEIGERVSKSRTAITNSLRLLKLSEQVQQMLVSEMISAGHARAILPLPHEMQETVAAKVFDEKLSVRDTEKIVRTLLEPPKKKVEKQVDLSKDALYESLEERMKNVLGTKVVINRRKNNKGKIEIEYYSNEELERIIDLINSIGSMV